jgi:hypothetical protein
MTETMSDLYEWSPLLSFAICAIVAGVTLLLLLWWLSHSKRRRLLRPIRKL